jgi:hypothetical protein
MILLHAVSNLKYAFEIIMVGKKYLLIMEVIVTRCDVEAWNDIALKMCRIIAITAIIVGTLARTKVHGFCSSGMDV